MRYPRLALFAIAGPAVLGPSPQLRADEDDDTAAVYKKAVDSAAFIAAHVKGGYAIGTGTLVDKTKRYVVTNCNVVDGADKIHVQFPIREKDGTILKDKKTYLDRIPKGEASKGTVVYLDRSRDLAIVQ